MRREGDWNLTLWEQVGERMENGEYQAAIEILTNFYEKRIKELEAQIRDLENEVAFRTF